jgi:hypothetical protein
MGPRWFEPIDFAALAVERSKKGWRPTPEQKAKWAKQRAAKKRKARAAASERLKAERKLARAIEFGQATQGAGETFLATFQPGCWYGVGDLQAASGLKSGTVKGLAAKFWKRGTLVRTKNPAFERPGWKEPEWLYGLNPQVQNQVANKEQRGRQAEDE